MNNLSERSEVALPIKKKKKVSIQIVRVGFGSRRELRLGSGNNIGKKRLGGFSVGRTSPKAGAVKLIPHLLLESDSVVVVIPIGLRGMKAFDIKRVVGAHGVYPGAVDVVAAPARAAAARGLQEPFLEHLPAPPIPQHSAAQPRGDLVDCEDQEIRDAAGEAAAHGDALRRRAADHLSHAGRRLRGAALQQRLPPVGRPRRPENYPVRHRGARKD
ncbi:hypothetical protein E2542_SST11745 [Spatholobus suberectus]|nr:hypothetical protein E2542_SST11745 [Spatholobus suberectus]